MLICNDLQYYIYFLLLILFETSTLLRKSYNLHFILWKVVCNIKAYIERPLYIIFIFRIITDMAPKGIHKQFFDFYLCYFPVISWYKFWTFNSKFNFRLDLRIDCKINCRIKCKIESSCAEPAKWGKIDIVPFIFC